jgi:hypothetical protein
LHLCGQIYPIRLFPTGRLDLSTGRPAEGSSVFAASKRLFLRHGLRPTAFVPRQLGADWQRLWVEEASALTVDEIAEMRPSAFCRVSVASTTCKSPIFRSLPSSGPGLSVLDLFLTTSVLCWLLYHPYSFEELDLPFDTHASYVEHLYYDSIDQQHFDWTTTSFGDKSIKTSAVP